MYNINMRIKILPLTIFASTSSTSGTSSSLTSLLSWDRSSPLLNSSLCEVISRDFRRTFLKLKKIRYN